MKSIAGFFLTVIAAAGISSACTLYWCRHAAPTAATAHEWLHHELNLTTQQQAALDPIERRFAARQEELSHGLHGAEVDLSRAIGEDKAYTPRVAAAVEMVHHRMGDLQKASIEHVFEMRSVLTPEQGDQLLHLAQQSLESTP